MVNESTHATKVDEHARQRALAYAASTMHFVRSETLESDPVDFTESPLQQQAVTYHGHPGKAPLRIDMLAQRHFERVVSMQPPSPLLGEIIVLGEEASLPDWNPNRAQRTTIFRCDPVDGTSSLAHLGEGYSTVVTVESRKDSGQPWKHWGGAIVRSDGVAISWSRRTVLGHHVVLDLRHKAQPGEEAIVLDLDTIPPLHSRDVDELHRKKLALSGATVAAQSSKRRALLLSKYQGLVAEADFFDFRAGSASAWPLCNGLLGWIIELNSTTIHDSIHLFPFALVGGRIVDAEHHGAIDVRRLVEQNAGPEALEKIFPPYIAFVDDESLSFIQRCAS